MAVTQKEIARHLGLSQPIVAQALRGHPAVAEKTRLRVEEAARAMGYGAHSNAEARSLIARRHGSRSNTGTIAVLTGSIFEGTPLHDVPFFKPLFRGIEQEAAERELDVSLILSTRSQLPRLVVQQGVDGVIAIYSRTMNILLRQAQLPLPVLSLGDAGPGEACIMPDNFEGARMATRHLIELGHRRIAYLGYLNTGYPEIADRLRLDGYLKALKESGIGIANELVDTHLEAPSQEAGSAGMQRLWKRAPGFTALVCYNDSSAMGAIRQAEKLGMKVPRDLSVVGFDDTSEEYDFTPHITTIHFDRQVMGARAVQWLCAEKQDEKGATPQHELLPVKLIERETTRRPSHD